MLCHVAEEKDTSRKLTTVMKTQTKTPQGSFSAENQGLLHLLTEVQLQETLRPYTAKEI